MITVSFYAGASTPATNPLLYIRCVRAAFDSYLGLTGGSDESSLPPLVINTHGWVTGMGIELVRTILAITRPQLVLRIQSESPQATIPTRSSSEAAKHSSQTGTAQNADAPLAKRRRSALARCGPLALALEAAGEAPCSDGSPCVLVELASASSKSSANASKPAGLSAPDMRWLRMASYFRPDLDPCKPPFAISMRDYFDGLPQVRIAMSSVSFGMSYGSLPAGEVEAAFTGTIVALCAAAATSEVSSDVSAHQQCMLGNGGAGASSGQLAVFADASAEAMRCFGIAFLHSFDHAKSEVVLTTGASVATLSSVNAIIRGDIVWEPHSTRGQRVPVSAMSPLQPYNSFWVLEGLATGARVVTTRTNLRRKRLRGTGQ